ncbi:uncharacterized protein BCR38DRAFT_486615 [Pseudomassariella vexata]|uniref:Uncharacterized protein n=1 Tax=Pseudomassariella vexata TaxID=1141098 RepID=A0A1Y2DSX9_9PEZI|nr:uncharacterized protein BCR38DRAFT_486615 [Pseudomassariella vexata]ORY62357.1 hypothetical protein BCR38DRAFT_486615 [Pseudomassariella vexata]
MVSNKESQFTASPKISPLNPEAPLYSGATPQGTPQTTPPAHFRASHFTFSRVPPTAPKNFQQEQMLTPFTSLRSHSDEPPRRGFQGTLSEDSHSSAGRRSNTQSHGHPRNINSNRPRNRPNARTRERPTMAMQLSSTPTRPLTPFPSPMQTPAHLAYTTELAMADQNARFRAAMATSYIMEAAEKALEQREKEKEDPDNMEEESMTERIALHRQKQERARGFEDDDEFYFDT